MAKLYVLPVSVNCQGVQVLVAEAGLQIETVMLDPTKDETGTPEFSAKNPFQCTPLLEDKGTHIWESNAILRFLCNSNNLTEWYPSEPRLRAKIEEFLDFRQSSYYKAQADLCYPAFGFCPETVKEETARQVVQELLEMVVSYYLKDGLFLCGMKHVTIADLSFAMSLTHLNIFPDFKVPDAIQEYLQRVEKACPSWATIRAPLDGYITFLQEQRVSKLYVLPVSVNCHGPQVLIAENHLNIQTVALDMTKGETTTAEFTAKNPYQCTPTLFDNRQHLWESNAIMRYLCNAYKLEKWYPSEPKARARIEQFLDFRQSHYYPDQADFTYPSLGVGSDFEKAKIAQQNVLADLELVAKHYLQDGKFVCGFDHPTIADLSFALALTHLAVHKDFALPAAIQAYKERCDKALPSWKAIRAPLEGYISFLHSKSQATTAVSGPEKKTAEVKEGKEATFTENDFVELFGLSNTAFNGQTGVVTGFGEGRYQIKLASRELVRIRPINLRKVARPQLTAEQTEEAKREQQLILQQSLENSREAKFRLCALVKDRKYHFRTYPHCFVGKDTVTALVEAGVAKNRADAVAFGNKVMEAGVFFHCTKEHVFKDENLYYRFATSEALLNVGPRFWNIRGSFKIKAGGVEIADAGTHMSLVQLPNGNFVVLDTIDLTEAARAEIDALTNGGKKIEAVFALHPYHTLWFPSFYKYYPNAKYYGCPRHLAKLTGIPWAGCFVEPAVLKLYEPYLFFRISKGAEFVNPAPDNHFASVVAFHKESATIHADDTFMYWSSPNLLLRLAGLAPNTLSFHLTINSNLADPLAFKAWVQQIITDWDFDNICAAHTGNRIGGGKQMLTKLLADSETKLQKLAVERGKGIAPPKPTPEECGRTEGDECG